MNANSSWLEKGGEPAEKKNSGKDNGKIDHPMVYISFLSLSISIFVLYSYLLSSYFYFHSYHQLYLSPPPPLLEFIVCDDTQAVAKPC